MTELIVKLVDAFAAAINVDPIDVMAAISTLLAAYSLWRDIPRWHSIRSTRRHLDVVMFLIALNMIILSIFLHFHPGSN